MNHHHHLGIDIAKLKFDVCLLPAKHKQSFANTPRGFQALLRWLQKHPVLPSHCHVALEATGSYGLALARFLHHQGFALSLVNPARIRFFAQSLLTRNKTDALDAEIIARFCLQQQPRLWNPPSDPLAQLQALSRLLQDLIGARQDQANRLEAASHPTVRSCLRQLHRQLEAHIQKVKEQLHCLIQAHPQFQRQAQLLVSIPGVGEATTATVLAELPLDRLDDARQAAAYAGLTPRLKQSGTSVRGRSGLSKTGNPALRKALYFPALTALRCNPIIMALAKRLRAAGKSKMCIVGAAMRKLLHLIWGVLKSNQPFDPDWLTRSIAR